MRMRRALSVVMMAALAVIIGGPLGAPLVSAQSASIDAWAELATANPGVGCAVDISVEVRSGGAGLAGADISVVVSDDASGATVSSDATTANGSGVAWLTIDTIGTAGGDKTWMNILVNGVYVGGQTIWITDGGSCVKGMSKVCVIPLTHLSESPHPTAGTLHAQSQRSSFRVFAKSPILGRAILPCAETGMLPDGLRAKASVAGRCARKVGISQHRTAGG